MLRSAAKHCVACGVSKIQFQCPISGFALTCSETCWQNIDNAKLEKLAYIQQETQWLQTPEAAKLVQLHEQRKTTNKISFNVVLNK